MVPYSRRSWQSALPPAAAERQQMSVSVPASPPRLPTPRSAPALCPATHFFTSSTLFFYFSFSLFPPFSSHFRTSILKLVLGLRSVSGTSKQIEMSHRWQSEKRLGIPMRDDLHIIQYIIMKNCNGTRLAFVRDLRWRKACLLCEMNFLNIDIRD